MAKPTVERLTFLDLPRKTESSPSIEPECRLGTLHSEGDVGRGRSEGGTLVAYALAR
jgi:hypothetical protein